MATRQGRGVREGLMATREREGGWKEGRRETLTNWHTIQYVPASSCSILWSSALDRLQLLDHGTSRESYSVYVW